MPFILGSFMFFFKKRGYLLAGIFISSITTCLVALMFLKMGIQTKHTITGLYGVEVIFDRISSVFLLTSGIVMLLVSIDSVKDEEIDEFRPMIPVLMAAMNASFVSFDFFNVYVTLELVTIVAFILIGARMLVKRLWGGIKYLLVGNTGMLFYLLGVALYYQDTGTFSMSAAKDAPVISLAMMTIGLFIKGGVFLSGLWLPDVHGEASTPISALLSGVVVKTGIYPLLRIIDINPSFGKVITIFGLLSALLGAFLASFERDSKRTLAFSTVSQVGYSLSHPVFGAFYVFAHGMLKSWLFLRVGKLKSRDFTELQSKGVPLKVWISILIPSLALSGIPFLGTHTIKSLMVHQMGGWQRVTFYASGILTAAVFARFVFLPPRKIPLEGKREKIPLFVDVLYFLFLLLLDIILRIFRIDGFEKLSLTLLTIGAGWVIYLILRKTAGPDLRTFENIDHLIGLSIVVLLLLLVFGGVLVW